MSASEFKQELYKKYISTGQTKNRTDNSSPFKENAPYVNDFINHHIKNKQSHIIDLGCGSGMYLYFLKQKGYQNCKGCDLSEEQVNLAHSLGIKNVVQNDLFSYIDSIEEKVDYFLLIDIIEHINLIDTSALIVKLRSMLNPNGKIIIHVPNAEGIFGMKIRYGDLTHELAFTNTSLRQLLMNAGFNKLDFFEEKPIIYSFSSFIRRVLWTLFTLPFRILSFAESGSLKSILSKNILVVATI